MRLAHHVTNAGCMAAPAARSRGIASAMCEHPVAEARRVGFGAMQYNFVVSTHTGAARLWRRRGFQIVDQAPGAFRHRVLGATAIYAMHRHL